MPREYQSEPSRFLCFPFDALTKPSTLPDGASAGVQIAGTVAGAGSASAEGVASDSGTAGTSGSAGAATGMNPVGAAAAGAAFSLHGRFAVFVSVLVETRAELRVAWTVISSVIVAVMTVSRATFRSHPDGTHG